LKIHSAVGDMVEEHQTLLILEAMKMETEVKAPWSGKITDIFVTVDDAVQTADSLIAIG
jgi:oxaloacetate decarboxylase (Na+ extruding) subunit alpha